MQSASIWSRYGRSDVPSARISEYVDTIAATRSVATARSSAKAGISFDRSVATSTCRTWALDPQHICKMSHMAVTAMLLT
eukprot:SAG31_NODE_4992_length_2815_cov_1.867820_2_plen_80_part_00